MSIKKVNLNAPWSYGDTGDEAWVIDAKDNYLAEAVVRDSEDNFIKSATRRGQMVELMSYAPRMLYLLQCVQDMMTDKHARDGGDPDVQEQGLLADIGTCIEAAAPYPVQWPDEWKREGWKL